MTINFFKFKPNFFVIYCEFCMNAKTNKGKRTPSPRRKAQTSMEYIIILAVVVIGALVVGFLYLHSIGSAKIGTSDSVMAAGSSGPGYLTLALSAPLPVGASVTAQLTGGATASGTIASTSAQYTNNYPEYVFSGNNIADTDNVTGVSYSLNGQTINIATSTGSPLPIQQISTANVVTP